MKEEKEKKEKTKKVTKDKKVKKKKKVKKLKISDIKRSKGAEVSHLLSRIKAREVELTFCCVVICLVVICVSLYFVFSAVRDPKDYNTMTVGDFSVSFNTVGESLGNIINLTPLTPISDAQGQEIRKPGRGDGPENISAKGVCWKWKRCRRSGSSEKMTRILWNMRWAISWTWKEPGTAALT